jgi:hypothetical protein
VRVSKTQEELTQMIRFRNHVILVIFIVLVTGAALLTFALDFCCVPKEDLPKMKPEARPYYDKALYYLDHVDPEMAITQLQKAAAIDPELTSLDYLLVEMALERAQITYGETSVKYYDIAETAINDILKNPKISDADRQDAERRLKLIRSEREKVSERDARRETIGKILIQDKLALLFPETPIPTPSPIPTPAAAPTSFPVYYAPPAEAPSAPPPGVSSPFNVTTPVPTPPPAPGMGAPMKFMP